MIVTLFKKRGDPIAENFRISQGNRGDPLSEWDYLTIDNHLKSLNVKFSIVDYVDAKSLPNGLSDKVKSPTYLELQYSSNRQNVIAYPEKSPLDSISIRQWIVDTIKKISPEKLSSIDETVLPVDNFDRQQLSVDPAAKIGAKPSPQVVPASTEQAAVAEEQVTETTKGLFNLGIGLGGTLLIACLGVAGVVVGSFAADNFNKNGDDGDLANSSLGGEDEHPLYIESITGGKLDFTKIWEERPPKSRSNESKKIHKDKEEMETPLPSNIQTVTNEKDEVTPFDKYEDV